MRLASTLLLLGLALPARAETLRVLTTELPPFFFHEGGEPAGIEYELVRYYAKANDLDLEIVWVGHWPELLPALEDGRGDLVAAACTITEARRARFDFAPPHFPVRMQLVERTDFDTRYLQELAGERLGVLKGSTGRDAFARVPNASIVSFDTVDELFRAVSEGSVRAIASESADAFLFLDKLDNLRMGIPLSEQQHYGFALPKGSPHREALGEHVTRLKASGIYYRIVEKYLGKRAVQHFKDNSR